MSRISAGKRLVAGVDGRTAAARRFRDLVKLLSAEVGGAISETDQLLVHQAASLTVQAEQLQAALLKGEAVDPDATVRLANAVSRTLSALRRKAKAQKPAPRLSLRDKLAQEARTAA